MTRLDCRVAISVSDPGEEELARRGIGDFHVKHAFVELARQILAAGGDLAYGGDLRRGGYTQTLISLLWTYSAVDRPKSQRITQYLTPHAAREMDGEAAAELSRLAAPILVDSPSAEEPLERALALQAMRTTMSQETGARIALGGRLEGQLGRWPGVVEEAYLAVLHKQPLFVLGGLGGAAARLVAAMRGEWPVELTTEFQLQSEDRATLAELAPNESELREVLQGAELGNGLSAEENAELQCTADLDLMVALVMRGLGARHGDDQTIWGRQVSKRIRGLRRPLFGEDSGQLH